MQIIILARANSTGLINKNFLPLNGKMVVEWSVEFALQHVCDDDVFLATDSPLGAKICKKYNIHWLRRPESVSKTNTPCKDTLLWCFNEISNTHPLGLSEHIIEFDGNLPMRYHSTVDRVQQQLELGETYIQTITPCDVVHPYYMLKYNEQGKLVKLIDAPRVYSRQELPLVYREQGSCLGINTTEALKPGFFEQQFSCVIEDYVPDMDNIFDFLKIEAMMKYLDYSVEHGL